MSRSRAPVPPGAPRTACPDGGGRPQSRGRGTAGGSQKWYACTSCTSGASAPTSHVDPQRSETRDRTGSPKLHKHQRAVKKGGRCREIKHSPAPATGTPIGAASNSKPDARRQAGVKPDALASELRSLAAAQTPHYETSQTEGPLGESSYGGCGQPGGATRARGCSGTRAHHSDARR